MALTILEERPVQEQGDLRSRLMQSVQVAPSEYSSQYFKPDDFRWGETLSGEDSPTGNPLILINDKKFQQAGAQNYRDKAIFGESLHNLKNIDPERYNRMEQVALNDPKYRQWAEESAQREGVSPDDFAEWHRRSRFDQVIGGFLMAGDPDLPTMKEWDRARLPFGQGLRRELESLESELGFAQQSAKQSGQLRIVSERPIGEPDDIEPEFSDYARQSMATFASMGAGLGWLGQKLGEKSGINFLERAGIATKEAGRSARDSWINDRLSAVGLTQDGLSENARHAMEVEFLGDSSFGEKWQKAKLLAIGSLPATLGGLGAGGVLAKGLSLLGMPATGAAAIGYGLGEAGVAAPMSGEQVDEEIMQMPEDEIQASPEYQLIYNSLENLDPDARAERARRILAGAAAGSAAEWTLYSTFALSAPAGVILQKFLPGGVPQATGRIKGTLKGAGTESVQEFFQSGTEQLSQNAAMRAAGFDGDLWDGVLEEAVGGALSGAPLGGAMGFVAPGGAPETATVPGEDEGRQVPEGAVEAETVLGEVEEGPAERVYRYQLMQNSSGSSPQLEVMPLTEERFQTYIKPYMAENAPSYANTVEEYQQKHPDNTHLQLIRNKGDKQWKPYRTGTIETLTQFKGQLGRTVRPVDDFESQDSADWARMKASEVGRVAPGQIDAKKDSLAVAISKLGGLNRQVAEAEGLDPAELDVRGHGIKRVFTQNGRTAEDLAEVLSEHGYPVVDESGTFSGPKLMERLQEEMAGEEVTTAEGAEARMEQEAAEREEPEVDQGLVAQQLSELAYEAPPEYQELSDDEARSLADLAILAREYADEDAVQDALMAGSDNQAAQELWNIIRSEQVPTEPLETKESSDEGKAGTRTEPAPASEPVAEEVPEPAEEAGEEAPAAEEVTPSEPQREKTEKAAREGREAGTQARTGQQEAGAEPEKPATETGRAGVSEAEAAQTVVAEPLTQEEIDQAANVAATSPENKLSEPTQAQKEAGGEGNYKLGDPVKLYGVTWRAENPKGSYRYKLDESVLQEIIDRGGKESPLGRQAYILLGELKAGTIQPAFRRLRTMQSMSDGTAKKKLNTLERESWFNKMPAHYARALEIEGADGDKLDAFLGLNAENQNLPVYVADMQRLDGKGYDESKVLIGFNSRGSAWNTLKASYDAGMMPKLVPKGIESLITFLPEEFKAWVESGKTTKPAAEAKRPVKKKRTKKKARKPTKTIDDFGEKIGGARKDVSGPRQRGLRKGKGPAWLKKYTVGERMKDGKPTGVFSLMYGDGPYSRTIGKFDSREEAEFAIPLAEVARKHAVRRESTDSELYAVWRKVTNRKRIIVQGGFESRDEAMSYMAANALEIINWKPAFPVRPHIEDLQRIGEEHRDADVSPQQFMDTFGFRGGEFGNWLPQDERQSVLNMSFDALSDLANTLNVPPRALSLGGELGVGFGSRGQGLSSAQAHYEPDKVVINLTRIKGAGSLAHEWFHAFDHYLARQDGKDAEISGRRKSKARERQDRFVTHGFSYKSQVRVELRKALNAIMDTMMRRKKEFDINVDRLEKFTSRYEEELADNLDNFRLGLTQKLTYGKRNVNPASKEQLKKADSLIAKLKKFDLGEEMYVESERSRFGGHSSFENLEALSKVYKKVRGRSGWAKHDVFTRIYSNIATVRRARSELAAALKKNVETRTVSTDYYSNAKHIDRYRVSNYYSLPHELAARAFESHIYDRTIEQERRSDYLVHSVTNDLYMPGMDPYPAGEERADINNAFDALFETIKSRVEDENTILFRIGEEKKGMGIKRVQRFVNEITANWNNLPAEIIVTTRRNMRGVPDDIQQKIKAMDPESIAMGANSRTGSQVFIFADNLPSLAEAERVIIHEIKGHFGTQAFLGDAYKTFAERAFRAFPELAVQEARHIRADLRKTDDRMRVADEIIARIAENIEARTATAKMLKLWDQFYSMFIRALRKLGLTNYVPTRVELRNMVREASRYVEEGIGQPLPTLKPSPATDLMVAYHGSPYRFEKFDINQIGKGEGSQAFGWGLYFAESEKAAGYYQSYLSGTPDRIEGALYGEDRDPFGAFDNESSQMRNAIDEFESGVMPHDQFIQAIKDYGSKELKDWLNSRDQSILSGGHLYEVDIPDEIVGKMLDWDKPLSKQSIQWESANPVVSDVVKDIGSNEYTGGEFYRELANELKGQKAASDRLAEIGIPGIKFLDQQSRNTVQTQGFLKPLADVVSGKEKRTRNLVLFDDSLVMVKKIDGKPVVKGTEMPAVDDALAAIVAKNGLLEDSINARLKAGQVDEVVDYVTNPDNAVDLARMRQDGVERREKSFLQSLKDGQLLDKAFRLPFHMFGAIDEHGVFHVSPKAKVFKSNLVEAARAFMASDQFSWLHHIVGVAHAEIIKKYGIDDKWTQAVETTKRGLFDRYGQPQEYKKREFKRQADERALLLEAQKVLHNLVDEGVGKQEAEVLYRMLTGQEVTNKQIGKLAPPIQLAIDQMGQEAVELGLISAESYERNRGAYLHRSYQIHEGKKTPLGKMASDLFAMRRRRIIGNQFKGRGIFLKKNMDKVLARIPEDWWGRKKKKGKADLALIGQKFVILDRVQAPAFGTMDMVGIDPKQVEKKIIDRMYWPADLAIPNKWAGWESRGEFEVRDVVRGELVLWRDFTDEERSRMGEIVDARYAIAKTYMQMAHDLSTGRFFSDIASNQDWASKTDPGVNSPDGKESRLHLQVDDTWVRVPDTKIPKSNTARYGALAGMYVRSEIWKDMVEIRRMQNHGFWRKVMTSWKLSKTSRNPVVHLNNILANVMLMDMVDVRAQDLVQGIRSFIDEDAYYQDALTHGAFGGDIISQEIRKGVLDPILRQIEQENVADTGTGIWGVMMRFGTLIRNIDDRMQDIYRMEDEVFRMATYIRQVGLGFTPEEAAMHAKEQFLNYDIRAPWVNALRETVLPFISYTYRAVPIVAQSMAARPWKMAKYFTVAYLANTLGYMLGGDPDDEDEERATLREGERGRVWLGVYRMLRTPFRDRWGNPIFLDIRRWIPAGDVFDMHQGSSALPIPAPIQFGGPIMIASELMLNRAAFTGQDIVNDLTDTGGEKAAKWADFLWKSFAPSAPWIPNSWYWSKIKGAATGELDPMMREYSVPLAISSSLGLKLKPHDVQLSRQYLMMHLDYVERSLNQQLQALSRDLARKRVDRDYYDQRVEEIREKLQRLGERRREALPRQ